MRPPLSGPLNCFRPGFGTLILLHSPVLGQKGKITSRSSSYDMLCIRVPGVFEGGGGTFAA